MLGVGLSSARLRLLVALLLFARGSALNVLATRRGGDNLSGVVTASDRSFVGYIDFRFGV